MKVLIACEESQTVCIAFRERGHEAYSCDIQEPSGRHPEEWRAIPGFPEYEASSLGRIRSVCRTINYSNGRVVHAKHWRISSRQNGSKSSMKWRCCNEFG